MKIKGVSQAASLTGITARKATRRCESVSLCAAQDGPVFDGFIVRLSKTDAGGCPCRLLRRQRLFYTKIQLQVAQSAPGRFEISARGLKSEVCLRWMEHQAVRFLYIVWLIVLVLYTYIPHNKAILLSCFVNFPTFHSKLISTLSVFSSYLIHLEQWIPKKSIKINGDVRYFFPPCCVWVARWYSSKCRSCAFTAVFYSGVSHQSRESFKFYNGDLMMTFIR